MYRCSFQRVAQHHFAVSLYLILKLKKNEQLVLSASKLTAIEIEAMQHLSTGVDNFWIKIEAAKCENCVSNDGNEM